MIEVTVIGGGIIGCSIAWRLAQRGCRVEVFDAGRIGGAASWAGAGMLAPGGEVTADSPWARRSIESARMYESFVRELEAESGVAIDYQRCGALELAYTEYEAESIRQRAADQTALGISSIALDVRSAAEMMPGLAIDRLVAARFYPEDAAVDPRSVVAALTAALRARGVGLHEHSPVMTMPDGIVVIAAGA